MATEEVGIRLTLQGRREAAEGLRETTQGLEDVGEAAQTAGSRASRGFAGLKKFGGFLATTVKRGFITAAAVGVAALGTALYKGFQRLTGIENATAKLTGLGNSTRKVDKIMRNALASVKGTAFGMDEAATTAAGAVAAGVKPGRELQRTLKLVADAATIGGTSMSEMGGIFNKVATSNKIQGDVIAQLSDKGIPIVQLLAKQLGVTGEEVVELASKGKIGFNTFRKAMADGMGGAALKSGETTTGALSNVNAAMGRFGATLLGGVFPLFKDVFGEIIIAVDGLTERVGPLMERLNEAFGPKITAMVKGSGQAFLDWVDSITQNVPRIIDTVTAKWDNLKASFASWRGSDSSANIGEIKDNVVALGPALGELAKSGVGDTMKVLNVTTGFLADHTDLLAKAMPFLVAGYVALKVSQMAGNLVMAASLPMKIAEFQVNRQLIKSNVALVASRTADTVATGANTTAQSVGIVTRARAIAGQVLMAAKTKILTAVTIVQTTAMKALNLVMRMNPIGLVITAITLLVGAFILAYKKSETFRDIVHGALDLVKRGAEKLGDAAVWVWENGLLPLWEGMKKVGSFLKGLGIGAIKLYATVWLTVAKTVLKAVGWLVGNILDGFGTIISGAAKAFGWVPGIGGKLKTAEKAFGEFTSGVKDKFASAQTRIDGLQTKVDDLGSSKPVIKVTADVDSARATLNAFWQGIGPLTPQTFNERRGGGNGPQVPYAPPAPPVSPSVGGLRLPRIPALPDLGDDGSAPGTVRGGGTHIYIDGEEVTGRVLNRVEKRLARA
jgi:tape measure domain-containing protein